jgi:hypothetical protein
LDVYFFQPTAAFSGTVLTLFGRGLVAQGTSVGASINSITILIDKAPCENVVFRSVVQDVEEIQCTVSNYESGHYFVDVFIDGKGYASVNPADLVPGDIRNSTFVANSQSLYPVLFIAATATGISPSSGSLLGGTLVTVSGSGFSYLPSHLDVQIGGAPCRIVSSTFSIIQCITSASTTSPSTDEVRISVNGFVTNSSIQFEQSSQSTPTVTLLDRHSATGGDQLTITGMKFGSNISAVQVQIIDTLSDFDTSAMRNMCSVSSVTDTSVTCTLPVKPAGRYNLHVLILGLGFASTNGDNSISYSLAIDSFSPLSGGKGGGITVTIDGAGFPDITAGADLSIVTVTLCSGQVNCLVTQSSYASLMCTLGTNSLEQSEQNCTVSVSYNGNTETASEFFEFSSLLTPEVDSLSPNVGGTAGGTIVSLAGTGFFPVNITDAADLQASDISVTIDGVLCEWYGHNYQISDTSIICRTGEHRTTLEAVVRVYVRGKGYATSNESSVFEYVDRWSSRFTWGGNALPHQGESVYIKSNQTVYLDISPPVLNLILIEGTLIFEDEQDLHLQAKYIFINGGRLQVT